MNMADFSKPNSIPTSWLYILIVCISVFNYFSFFVSTFMLSINLFLWFWKFVAASTFPKVLSWAVSLPWRIALERVNLNGRGLWIFTSAGIEPPTINSIFQFPMSFVIMFVILSDILYSFQLSIFHVCRTV